MVRGGEGVWLPDVALRGEEDVGEAESLRAQSSPSLELCTQWDSEASQARTKRKAVRSVEAPPFSSE